MVEQSQPGHHHGHVHSLKENIPTFEPDVFIGLSLCFGFIFMLLIDHISGGHSHGSSTGTDIKYKIEC